MKQNQSLGVSVEVDMAIDPELLKILVCPQCKGDLRLTPTEDGLICERCRLEYEIREGIPVMLPEKAKKFT